MFAGETCLEVPGPDALVKRGVRHTAGHLLGGLDSVEAAMCVDAEEAQDLLLLAHGKKHAKTKALNKPVLLAHGFLPDLLEGLDLQVLGELLRGWKGSAKKSTRTALNSEGLELSHISARELQKVSLVLHSRVSTVVLEELLDLVRQHAKQRNALGKRPPRLLLLALFLTQRCDLETNFPSIGVKAQCHGGTGRQNDQLRQLLVVAQRLGEARAAGEHFHLTHVPRNFQDDDGQAAQRLCRLLQGLLDLRVAGGTQLLAQPFFCGLLVAAKQHVDNALVKACVFACLEKGEALAGLVIAPDQHGGAIMQVQQPADLGLAHGAFKTKHTAAEHLRCRAWTCSRGISIAGSAAWNWLWITRAVRRARSFASCKCFRTTSMEVTHAVKPAAVMPTPPTIFVIGPPACTRVNMARMPCHITATSLPHHCHITATSLPSSPNKGYKTTWTLRFLRKETCKNCLPLLAKHSLPAGASSRNSESTRPRKAPPFGNASTALAPHDCHTETTGLVEGAQQSSTRNGCGRSQTTSKRKKSRRCPWEILALSLNNQNQDSGCFAISAARNKNHNKITESKNK